MVEKKMMFIVSTGRCGTTRLYELLHEKMPCDIKVIHQMPFSPIANVCANIMHKTGEIPMLTELLYSATIGKIAVRCPLICADPLTSMVIPQRLIQSPNVSFVHIVRDCSLTAKSYLRFSKTKVKSYIAHFFVPFWMPGIWPLERYFNRLIEKKYYHACIVKNAEIQKRYGASRNYHKIRMEDMFSTDILHELIKDIFGVSVLITSDDLKLRSNNT